MNNPTYKIASSFKGKAGSSFSNLEASVNALIAEGYELYGSPFVFNTLMCQAMVKQGEKAKKKVFVAP